MPLGSCLQGLTHGCTIASEQCLGSRAPRRTVGEQQTAVADGTGGMELNGETLGPSTLQYEPKQHNEPL